MELKPGTLLELRKQGIYVYDNSQISGSFLTCPLLYYYKHECGLVPKNRNRTNQPSIKIRPFYPQSSRTMGKYRKR